MQSKLDYKIHTKVVDLESLKNTQHSLAPPQFLETLSETALHIFTVFAKLFQNLLKTTKCQTISCFDKTTY